MGDPREADIPDLGIVQFSDMETGEKVLFDTWKKKVREFFRNRGIGVSRELDTTLKFAGIDVAEIQTDTSYIQPLKKLFHKRTLQ